MASVVSALLFVQLLTVSVTGSMTHSRLCGADKITYSSSSDYNLFYINENPVDKVLFCKVLGFYYNNGCFFEVGLDDWRGVAKNYCGLELFIADLPVKGGRKLLLEAGINEPTINNFGQRSHSGEKIHAIRPSLTPNRIAMAAVPAAFLLCCTLLCQCCRPRRKETDHAALTNDISMDSVHSLGVRSLSEKIQGSPMRVPPSPRFSMSPKVTRLGSIHLNMNQVNRATRNFSSALQIGEGGFGTVYKAQLQDGQVVAIKRAKKEHIESLKTEFSSEVELLAKIDHRNLVKLLGYVDKGDERIIITEFIPNGTLREHLDGQRGKILDFNRRLEISIDVTHALTYLHLYAEKPIIHRDVKSSNILLTDSLRAKVADFGFARLGPMEADQTHISTKVKGTAGYLDPEYLKTYQLTPKSDVYSFGILLIEILTSRRPVELKRAADERVTVRWAFNKYNEGNVEETLDPLMEEVVDTEILMKMFALAFQCAAPTRSDRPDMKEVSEQLWAIRMDYLRSVKRG